jgi:predicted trehalose synthase
LAGRGFGHIVTRILGDTTTIKKDIANAELIVVAVNSYSPERQAAYQAVVDAARELMNRRLLAAYEASEREVVRLTADADQALTDFASEANRLNAELAEARAQLAGSDQWRAGVEAAAKEMENLADRLLRTTPPELTLAHNCPEYAKDIRSTLLPAGYQEQNADQGEAESGK